MRTWKQSLLRAIAAASLVLCAWTQAYARPSYSESLSQATVAEQGGQLERARTLLRALRRAFPDDFTAALRLAWVAYQLAHYPEAEQAYRVAAQLNPRSLDARTGLGWSLVQLGRCDDATVVMKQVLAEAPSDERARAGIAQCERTAQAERAQSTGSLWAGVGGSLYPRHPWKRRSVDVSGGLSLSALPATRLGAAYRFIRLDTLDARVPGYSQHEGYLQLGYEKPLFQLLLNGALIRNGADLSGGSHHVGVSSRVATTGTLLIDASMNFYRDQWIAAFSTGWEFLIDAVHVTPGVALQQRPGQTMGAVTCNVALQHSFGSFWLGGKNGLEYRPANLSQFSILNTDDRSRFGAWAGAQFPLSGPFALVVSYAFDRLEAADGVESDLHYLSLTTLYLL